MERNREMRYDQLLPNDDEVFIGKRAVSSTNRDKSKKSIEDTKRKIRDAFRTSEKMKATLRT